MLIFVFLFALIWVAWKMFKFGIKAAWGIGKLACTVLLLPVFLVGLICIGLTYVAIPLLVIAGLAALIGGIFKKC